MDTVVTQKSKKENLKASSVRIFAAVGAVAVLAGILFVGGRAIALLPNMKSALAGAFASLQANFGGDDGRITLSVLESEVVANEPFTLNWNHVGKETEGSYTFFYECNDDVYLQLKNDSGQENTIFCNRPLDILASETSLTLTPVGEITDTVSLPLSVRFTENNASRVRTEGTLAVDVLSTATPEVHGAATSTATTDTPSTPTTPSTPVTPNRPLVTDFQPIGTTSPAGPVSDPNGYVDLTVRVLAFGLVDKNTGAFTPLTKIPHDLPSNKRGAIQFEVQNLGTKTSPDWEFEAKLPTSPSYTYKSKTIQSLLPSERVEFVIGFDRVRSTDEDTYAIEVDPNHKITESNENNNRVGGTVQIDR